MAVLPLFLYQSATAEPEVVTVKLPVEDAEMEFTITVIFPDVAPAGTIAVNWDALAVKTVVSTPLKLIVLLAAIIL